MSDSARDEMPDEVDPESLVHPGRSITGISATLLPFAADGSVDWTGFTRHLERTVEAGLIPAVNMDTGYVNLIDPQTRSEVLDRTEAICGDAFVAGAYVDDEPGDPFDADAYWRRVDRIQERRGTPIIFQSFGITERDASGVVDAYETIASYCDEFYAFELGEMFAPFGRIYDLETYARLMEIPACIGAKHSSLDRELEWRRLALRDEHRPEFTVLTGNDLAIDMVRYGSDYLLGLSTFAPDLFAERDRFWASGDPAFYELNDLLQYLGFFAFRPPVPAYKHSAAQFLAVRGWLEDDHPHPEGARRPETDLPVLRDIARRLGVVD